MKGDDRTVESSIVVGGRRIILERGDKVLFPADGITKSELIDYYQVVGERFIGYAARHPMVLRCFPEGIKGEGFFRKRAPQWYPSWIPRASVAKEGGMLSHVLCDDEATLVFLAEQAAIEMHLWLSAVPAVEIPDRVIFDLDPGPGAGLGALRSVAADLRSLLVEIGLDPHLMTSGSRGYHVVAALKGKDPFSQVHVFARRVAELVVSLDPSWRTVASHKVKRERRVFIDYLRNGYAQSAIAPYSVRALSGAPIAMPLSWDELDVAEPRSWHLRDVAATGARRPDPWSDLTSRAASVLLPSRLLEEAEGRGRIWESGRSGGR